MWQELLHNLLRDILRRRGVSLDALRFDGLIKVRELPFESEDEITTWWLEGRMSEREKERYSVVEAHNVLTLNGRAALLNYFGNPNPTSPPWSQQFGVGNFPIISVSPGDTSVQGEFYRNNPSAVVITGNNQIDLTTIFSGTNGNGRWFSCGLWGNGASSTVNTGTLNTHALISPSYVKSTGNIAIDYRIILT